MATQGSLLHVLVHHNVLSRFIAVSNYRDNVLMMQSRQRSDLHKRYQASMKFISHKHRLVDSNNCCTHVQSMLMVLNVLHFRAFGKFIWCFTKFNFTLPLGRIHEHLCMNLWPKLPLQSLGRLCPAMKDSAISSFTNLSRECFCQYPEVWNRDLANTGFGYGWRLVLL